MAPRPALVFLSVAVSGAARDFTAPAPWDTRSTPHAQDDVTRRRHTLLVDVTQAASEVSRLVHEAYDLHLPVEPGVREGRDALVRWAALLDDLIPKASHPPRQGPGACQGRLEPGKKSPPVAPPPRRA